MKDLNEVISLIAGIVKAADAANADGEIGLDDLGHLVPLVGLLSPAVDGIGNVSEEIANLTEEQQKEVHAHIEAEFGEGRFQEIGEDVFLAALYLASVYSKLK